MKFNKREKIILVAALIIAVAVIFINFIYFPITNDIKELKIQTRELSNQITAAKAKFEMMQSLRNQKDQLEKDISDKDDGVLKVWDQPTVLNFVETMTSNTAVNNSIEIFEPLSAGGIKAGETSLSINVDYDGLATLWGKFEKADYYTTVQAFHIEKLVNTSANESEKEKDLKVDITLRFYAHENSNPAFTEDDYDFMSGKYGKKNIIEQK